MMTHAEYERRRALREALAVALAPEVYRAAPYGPDPEGKHNRIAARIQDITDATMRALFREDESEKEKL